MNLMAPPWMFPGTNVSRPRRNPSSSSRASAGQNSEEMGMTAERQREIQASLFKMLGQQDDEVSAQAK